MDIPVKPGSRLERIIKTLLEKQEIIEGAKKGSIEINYAGSDQTVVLKMVI